MSRKPVFKDEVGPLHVRIPREQLDIVKIAALKARMTLSEFVSTTLVAPWIAKQGTEVAER